MTTHALPVAPHPMWCTLPIGHDGVCWPRPVATTRAARDLEIVNAFMRGVTVAELGASFDVRREEIQHVLERWRARVQAASTPLASEGRKP